MSEVATNGISAMTRMRDLLVKYPGAQRALFARYHIGGCRSCGFRPEESLGEVCARNENLPVDEVILHILDSHEADAALSIEPQALRAALAAADDAPRLVDIRTREEFEAVRIPGAVLFSEDLLAEIFSTWEKESPVVVYDHTGERSIDAAAYLIGHGFANVRHLRGGIDAYSRETDPSLPRYKIELE